MVKSPLISIVIPCKEIDEHARECIKYCKQLSYDNFEIIILPDHEGAKAEGARIIPTGPGTPGVKRNIGIANSKGEICAFIDADAYPRQDWLNNALKYLEDPQVVAVGGPGVTPKEDSIMRQASGHVLSSFMVGGNSSRYREEALNYSFESSDIHSCNFIARKTVLKEVGNWNEKYWPGEDTLICLAMKKLGNKLIEASDVVVYHHRRPLFIQHLKQMSRFALHRGFFAKKFRGNSLELTYFFPSLFVLLLLAGLIMSITNQFLATALSLAIGVYICMSLFASYLQVRDGALIIVISLGIIATHVVYGVAFWVGLMRPGLEK